MGDETAKNDHTSTMRSSHFPLCSRHQDGRHQVYWSPHLGLGVGEGGNSKPAGSTPWHADRGDGTQPNPRGDDGGSGSREPPGKPPLGDAIMPCWWGTPPLRRHRMYAVIGDSAAALTVGNGGRGESGVDLPHAAPPPASPAVCGTRLPSAAGFKGSGGRGVSWARGGGRIFCRREEVPTLVAPAVGGRTCLGGAAAGAAGGEDTRVWWAGEPVSFCTTSRKSFLWML